MQQGIFASTAAAAAAAVLPQALQVLRPKVRGASEHIQLARQNFPKLYPVLKS
jgi:hypothetical protein